MRSGFSSKVFASLFVCSAILAAGCGQSSVEARKGGGVNARGVGAGQMDMTVPVPEGTKEVRVKVWGIGAVEVQAEGSTNVKARHSAPDQHSK